MHCLLQHHRTPEARFPLTLAAGIERSATGLHVQYRLADAKEAVCWPSAAANPGFTDGLWQHTCFELFLSEPGLRSYREFNFSPSGHWAAYAFSDYRQREPWQVPEVPRLQLARDASHATLDVFLPAALLPGKGPLEAGITAVIAFNDASLDYLALHHAGERPDFHLRESFVLTLAPDTAQP